jgi:hypothetical protein
MNSRQFSKITFTFLFLFISLISATTENTVNENVLATDDISDGEMDKRAGRPFTSGSYGDFDNDLILIPDAYDSSYESFQKRSPSQFGDDIPGVLRFGKRSQSFIRFGRSGRSDLQKLIEKKQVPGVLRFGKRSDMPGVLRFGKRSDMPGVLRFGKRSDMPGVLRFGKRSDMPGVLRFGKRSDMPGVLRFGKRFEFNFLDKKSEMPGVLRFGRK